MKPAAAITFGAGAASLVGIGIASVMNSSITEQTYNAISTGKTGEADVVAKINAYNSVRKLAVYEAVGTGLIALVSGLAWAFSRP